ncbi:MAG: M15 family metallopeptidase [Spirochaetales bacterium]|nr:M15 family metallopeptidase [Spirochaetales bacterium]
MSVQRFFKARRFFITAVGIVFVLLFLCTGTLFADDTGERQTLAFARAYPGRIAERAFRSGEWALRIGDSWYSWARGRLLPEEERLRWEEFTGLRFQYSKGLPPVRTLSDEEKKRLKEQLAHSKEKPPRRHEEFLSRLLEAGTQKEAESRLVRVSVMGFPLRIHKIAAESLAAVDADLKLLAEKDAEARRFFAGISHIGSFNWRPIAGTSSRSLHGYGLALDFIAKSWGGKVYYWRSIMDKSEDWFELPYEKRWMIPLQVVEVFEKHGFIWGGKWLYFDTIHFEYRPEVMLLLEGDLE